MELIKMIENNELEEIGVVSSPSKLTELKVDIKEEVIGKNLLGNLCVIKSHQDEKDILIFGQITEIELRNVWLEQSQIRGIIKQKGPISPISGEHDLHIGKLSIISVFSVEGNKIKGERLGTVPSTNSKVYLVNKKFMDEFNKIFSKDRKLSFIGKYYGTDVLIPFEFRDFSKEDGGFGEAIHLGIFGKTGSGKSWLAKMIITCYAKNDGMSIFIFDPQGEFSGKSKVDSEWRELLRSCGKNVEIINIEDVRFISNNNNKTLGILERFLENIPIDEFWKLFGIFTKEKKRLLISLIINILKEKTGKKNRGPMDKYVQLETHKLEELLTREKFGEILGEIKKKSDKVYSKGGKKDEKSGYMKQFEEKIEENKEEILDQWERIAGWFLTDKHKRCKTIEEIANEMKGEDKVIILNLADEELKSNLYWNMSIKYFILAELVNYIKKAGEEEYLRNRILNTLVIIDEAHRFAPKEKPDDEELDRLKSLLIDSVRTTRKYGIGWMFISQTFSSIDKGILDQLRVFFVGYGLNYGSEWRRLDEIMGGEEALDIYKTFGDPLVSSGERRPSFIVKGPIIPFIPTSKAIAIDALNFPEEFKKYNFGDKK